MNTTIEVKQLNSNQLESAASILKAVAHPIRLSILQLLDTHERLSVNEICEQLDSEQSLTSHHLSNMKLKGILGSKREGQRVYYFLKLTALKSLLQCMENCVSSF
ncbi:MAG: helix-turn-helix transcriptional regulator [Aureispira sp.]|nr:helix-turn-helix transcriptional regulator [Aureispira sp.]